MNCGQLLIHWSVRLLFRDLNRLETWANRSHIKFKKGKCRVLHLRCNKPKQQDKATCQVAGKQLCRNGQGILMKNRLSVS